MVCYNLDDLELRFKRRLALPLVLGLELLALLQQQVLLQLQLVFLKVPKHSYKMNNLHIDVH